MFHFDFAAWFEDTYGSYKDIFGDLESYEEMGFFVNEDRSVYMHYDGHTLSFKVAKKYLKEYSA